ncbi:MAG TPA: hypothetical protein VE218_10925, partial [Acidobacteriaceae bacterium]|nr:hypothetical protein [Acidobacteriaceae bacterium]
MRQLGARPPGPRPDETGVETPSEILPHERHSLEEEEEPFRVEVYRIERKPIDPKPIVRSPETESAQAHPPAEAHAPAQPPREEEAKEI